MDGAGDGDVKEQGTRKISSSSEAARSRYLSVLALVFKILV